MENKEERIEERARKGITKEGTKERREEVVKKGREISARCPPWRPCGLPSACCDDVSSSPPGSSGCGRTLLTSQEGCPPLHKEQISHFIHLSGRDILLCTKTRQLTFIDCRGKLPSSAGRTDSLFYRLLKKVARLCTWSDSQFVFYWLLRKVNDVVIKCQPFGDF